MCLIFWGLLIPKRGPCTYRLKQRSCNIQFLLISIGVSDFSLPVYFGKTHPRVTAATKLSKHMQRLGAGRRQRAEWRLGAGQTPKHTETASQSEPHAHQAPIWPSAASASAGPQSGDFKSRKGIEPRTSLNQRAFHYRSSLQKQAASRLKVYAPS